MTKLRKGPRRVVSNEQGLQAHREGGNSQVGPSQEGSNSQVKLGDRNPEDPVTSNRSVLGVSILARKAPVQQDESPGGEFEWQGQEAQPE